MRELAFLNPGVKLTLIDSRGSEEKKKNLFLIMTQKMITVMFNF